MGTKKFLYHGLMTSHFYAFQNTQDYNVMHGQKSKNVPQNKDPDTVFHCPEDDCNYRVGCKTFATFHYLRQVNI